MTQHFFQTPGIQTGAILTSVSFNSLVGAGGFVDGIAIANDGTLYARNDSGTAYRWTGTQWANLITTLSIPSGLVSFSAGSNGCYEIAVAPSNGAVAYMLWGGVFLFTTNHGSTWTQATTGPTGVVYAQNDPNRSAGPYMAVDPQNPNIAFSGTPSGGVYHTSDGGVTWTQISTSTIPVPTGPGGDDGIMLVCFDPSSAVSGGAQQGIYIFSYGNGWYHSSNGGSTWALTSSGPTIGYCAACSLDGYLYAGDNTNSTLKIYNGSWSTSGATGAAPCSVAADPGTTGRVVISQNSGGYNVSTNHGATFAGFTAANSLTDTTVPWLATSSNVFLTIGRLLFDPSQSNRLLASAGVGVWVTTPTSSSSGATAAWTGQSLGVNNLIPFQIVSPPGGAPVAGGWDRPFFPIYPVPGPGQAYVPNTGDTLYQGYSIDWAKSSPNFLAGIVENYPSTTSEAGYSADGGQSWNVFSAQPSLIDQAAAPSAGGYIAVSTPSNIVLIHTDAGSNANHVYYTTNGGTSWAAATISGVSSTSPTGWKSNYYESGQFLCADCVTAGTFYAYNQGATSSTSGVYKSTNNGATFTLVYNNSGGGLSGQSSSGQLLSVPGNAGHLFFAGGAISGESFYYSLNGGSTWTALSGITNVYCFGFGQSSPASSYPVVYIIGSVGGVYGVWRNTKIFGGGAWQNLATYPSGNFNQPLTISGDNTSFGWFYIGFQNCGYLYGVSNDAAPWGTFTSPTQGSTVSGSVTLTVAGATDIGITQVQFQIDGANIGSPITTPPYTTSYNVTSLASGAHTFQAILSGNGQMTTALCRVTK